MLFRSPLKPRKVVVKVFDKLLIKDNGNSSSDSNNNNNSIASKKHRDYKEGDEYIELRLKPGDAYEMDGVRSRCNIYDILLFCESKTKTFIALAIPSLEI